MRLVFDLDECLVATRRAHRAAFRAAGVEPDVSLDHLPARFWVKDAEAYARKHEEFPAMLVVHGRRLPAMQLLLSCGGTILTGTSERSARAIVAQFPELRNYTILDSMSPDDKLDWLTKRAPGIYFDDSAEVVRRVREETRWQAVDVSGL